MRIEIEKLRTVTQRALKALEQRCGNSVELKDELYWSLPTDGKYDMRAQPTQPDVGSLVDDYNEIAKAESGEHDVVRYDLVYLGNIFIALGERIDLPPRGSQ